jgi:D-3-phosphoglycerate dehydrogenase
VVEVKGMELDAAFAPAMLYINNLDKPGFIGALGMLLGEAGVNIATFNLGRVSADEDAIALVGVDQAPDEARDVRRPLEPGDELMIFGALSGG